MKTSASNILFYNIGQLLTLRKCFKKQGRLINELDLDIISDAYLVVSKGKVIWIGNKSEFKKAKIMISKKIDLKGRNVLPAFVESHTHTVFAGDRADEFEMRQQGASYQEIAAAGGGIQSTMKKTRAISEKELIQETIEKINKFVRQGVGTLEIKTGYGLTFKEEFKLLKTIYKLRKTSPIFIQPTFLGAHAVAPEYGSAKDALKQLSVGWKELAKLNPKPIIDIFIDKGFFEPEESYEYLKSGKDLGFPIAVHANQLSEGKACEVAVKIGALSSGHLIKLSDSQISLLAKSEVTCSLLPTADLYLKCDYPPARKLLDQGARVALATDFNPGSSPTQDLALVGVLARLKMQMSLPEVISAYTVGGAYALGLETQKGHLDISMDADFIVTSKSWKELFYCAGDMFIEDMFVSGLKVSLN